MQHRKLLAESSPVVDQGPDDSYVVLGGQILQVVKSMEHVFVVLPCIKM